MIQIVNAMVSLAKELGVRFHTDAPVSEILTKNKTANGIRIGDTIHESDIIVSGADYHHTERLLQASLRGYSESYWKKKVFAPSSLLFYMGIDKKLKDIFKL